ncbi:chemotaxis protein CheW [Colwellia sp. 4_MG-2023]|uniref:chemotaxis protein CheW n=1 Tax=unclassified Colwellia TaxID=196834 RepID=UPI0026E3F797|nr:MULTISPECIES: chemotaxis protein CheW [unclassified Colwellia]MDO6506932.1 chemotaxis protein CheW [Colwellia sp. 5_MG-2023]MDO6556630.1 chemotaxis protein CheW [Colwellia sp. 4_MG-2023]
MSKSLAASKKVMKNYLSELLTDKPPMEDSSRHDLPERKDSKSIEEQRLENLLKNVNAELNIKETSVSTTKSLNKVIDTKKISIDEGTPEQRQDTIVAQKSSASLPPQEDKTYRDGDFQALFFNVGGLTVAVPLVELGGIHPIEKTTALMGKPEWYKGVMLYRDEKINVVDTALWVMPEKCDEKMKDSLNYQYVIMLGNSAWGLTAENLVDTVVLKQEEVKWLDAPSKRPWLAGLVKDKMCALLDVNSLIQLLNDGSGIHQDD